jgi:hypothetical protein
MYDIKGFAFDILIIGLYPVIAIRYGYDIESNLRYLINIKRTKSVEIEYRARYRRVFNDIDAISESSVQRASFWSVLNIVPDIVTIGYDIKANV